MHILLPEFRLTAKMLVRLPKNLSRIVNRLISPRGPVTQILNKGGSNELCFQDKTVTVNFHDTFLALLTNYFNRGLAKVLRIREPL